MSLIVLRRVSALFLSLFFGAAASPSAWAGVAVTAVGSPDYLLADTHLFSAPIGTAASGCAEFGQTQQTLLPPPHHAVNPVLGDFQVPAINQVPGYEALDGHSHIPFFFADNFDFQSHPLTGHSEYRISLLDGAGNGYQVVADFQVQTVPEPATWVLLGLGGLFVGGLARHRRGHIAAPADPA